MLALKIEDFVEFKSTSIKMKQGASEECVTLANILSDVANANFALGILVSQYNDPGEIYHVPSVETGVEFRSTGVGTLGELQAELEEACHQIGLAVFSERINKPLQSRRIFELRRNAQTLYNSLLGIRSQSALLLDFVTENSDVKVGAAHVSDFGDPDTLRQIFDISNNAIKSLRGKYGDNTFVSFDVTFEDDFSYYKSDDCDSIVESNNINSKEIEALDIEPLDLPDEDTAKGPQATPEFDKTLSRNVLIGYLKNAQDDLGFTSQRRFAEFLGIGESQLRKAYSGGQSIDALREYLALCGVEIQITAVRTQSANDVGTANTPS